MNTNTHMAPTLMDIKGYCGIVVRISVHSTIRVQRSNTQYMQIKEALDNNKIQIYTIR